MDYFRSVKNANWVTVREAGLEFETFLEEMVSHRFVLCPPGNGIDTHRLWEALYCQTIPVALANPGMDSFRDLPILFVNSFEKLTRDFLESEYERMASAEWNWPRLFLPWWRDRIRAEKEKLNGNEASISRGEFLRGIAEHRLRAFKRRVLRVHENHDQQSGRLGRFCSASAVLRGLQAAGHDLQVFMRPPASELAAAVLSGARIEEIAEDPYERLVRFRRNPFTAEMRKIAAFSPDLFVVALFQQSFFDDVCLANSPQRLRVAGFQSSDGFWPTQANTPARGAGSAL
jgi:hypothetical protein